MSEEATYSRSESYSRRSRRAQRADIERPVVNHAFKAAQPPVNSWIIVGWSVVISLLSVANPFLAGLADNLQTQNLYAGFAMQVGHVPYSDFFGTSGVLFYLALYLGSMFHSTIGIAVLQGVALGVAGAYFYKLMAYFSKSTETADSFTHWFYIFVLGLGFGGVYSSIFVLPFLLTSLWFLVRYFEGAVRDEFFILYGVDAALVFLIDPKSFLLWLVATLVLWGYAVQQHQQARGWYQFLAAIFGFLLVVYSVGYYAFIQQILGKAIRQTFIENISLDFGSQSFLAVVSALGVALVLTGFLKNFIKTLLSLNRKQYRHFKVIVLVAFILQLFFIVASSDFVVSKLLVLLPYGFVLAVASLSKRELGLSGVEQGAARPLSYLKVNLFLPALLCLYMPLQLAFFYLQEGAIHQERHEMAQYVKEHSEQEESIYVWDNSAQIYLESQRLASSKFITAKPYLEKKSHQNDLLFDLNQQEARYIVVNTSLPLLEGVQQLLDEHYVKVEMELGNLALYQRK